MSPSFKNIFYFLLLTLVFLGFLVFLNQIFEKEKIFYASISNSFSANFWEIKKIQEAKTGTLIFVGDIMLDRGVEYMIKKEGGNDWKFPFLKIADYLKGADVLSGNLEGPISDQGSKVGSIYSFRAQPEAMEGLIFSGFDVLSVANNHIFDYGRIAMEDSFQRLREAGIDYVGGGFNEKEAHSPIIKNVAGNKVAFLAYTNLGSENWSAKPPTFPEGRVGGKDNQSGIAWLNENISEDIKKAKEKADIVIVFFHWGNEYQKEPSEEQEFFGHLAIDSGADLVIGHHPHIIQKTEKYQNGYIVYSLGNFVFDQGFSEETMRGLIMEIKIQEGKIKEISPKEIKINNFFQPEIILEKEN